MAGEIFQTPSDNLPHTHLAFCNNVYQVSFVGIKRPGRGPDHPPSPSAGVEYESSFTITFSPCLLEILKDSPHFHFLQKLKFKS
jgi:hypothetical protein